MSSPQDTQITLKLSFEEDLTRVSVANLNCFDQLVRVCREAFPQLGSRSFKITYRDDENDEVSISSSGAVAEAFSVVNAEGRKLLKLKLTTLCLPALQNDSTMDQVSCQ